MNGWGGKRRKHVPPSLNNEQVLKARELRAANTPYKLLERMFNVDRHTLWAAITGRGAYFK